MYNSISYDNLSLKGELTYVHLHQIALAKTYHLKGSLFFYNLSPDSFPGIPGTIKGWSIGWLHNFVIARNQYTLTSSPKQQRCNQLTRSRGIGFPQFLS